MNTDQARFYLAAMIDGEGHVNCNLRKDGSWGRAIIIANTDMALIQAVAECCDLLGVDYTIKPQRHDNPQWKPVLRLGIYGMNNLKTIQEYVPLRSPEKIIALQQAISSMSSRNYLNKRQQREITWLYREGVPIEEIAIKMNCLPVAVKKIIARAETPQGGVNG